MAQSMYVVKRSGVLELRHVCFRPQFIKGKPDKNDVCLTARTLDEMQKKADALFPGQVDYSMVPA